MMSFSLGVPSACQTASLFPQARAGQHGFCKPDNRIRRGGLRAHRASDRYSAESIGLLLVRA